MVSTVADGSITQVGDNPGRDLELLKDACRYAVRSRGITAARVHRNVRVGANKAWSLVSLMASWGVVDAALGSTKARAVLVAENDLPALFERMEAASEGGSRG